MILTRLWTMTIFVRRWNFIIAAEAYRNRNNSLKRRWKLKDFTVPYTALFGSRCCDHKAGFMIFMAMQNLRGILRWKHPVKAPSWHWKSEIKLKRIRFVIFICLDFQWRPFQKLAILISFVAVNAAISYFSLFFHCFRGRKRHRRSEVNPFILFWSFNLFPIPARHR